MTVALREQLTTYGVFVFYRIVRRRLFGAYDSAWARMNAKIVGVFAFALAVFVAGFTVYEILHDARILR